MERDVDAQLENSLRTSRPAPIFLSPSHAGRSILGYWAVCFVLGVPLLWDWLSAWNVGATLGSPLLVVYLIVSFAVSQALYVVVARHDGRPLSSFETLMFGLGNGIAETLAFALVYRLGEVIGSAVVGLFFPGWASVGGFLSGLGLFVIYGGLIHGLYWLQILPPHLDDAPRSRAIRKVRPLFEVALVLGWSLCFWLFRDIWSVVFLHILVDVGLMLRVRPIIFGATR